MQVPEIEIPIVKIPIVKIPLSADVQLFIKREDLIHREISGNKYWKLFYNINKYLEKLPKNPLIITFGGAFSNHIAATAALGREAEIETLGIIRGHELMFGWQENATLSEAYKNGMNFRFVSREAYRNKNLLTQKFQKEFPDALVVPEGGTNETAVEGIKFMMTEECLDFDFLCSSVGTGGTVSGIAKFSGKNQKVLGFKMVKDSSLEERIARLSGRKNVTLLEAHEGKYGKITDETVKFINDFYKKYGVPLDPIYTGKMMRKIFELIDNQYFPKNSKILAFHTGGLQGIIGANQFLKKKKRPLVDVPFAN